MIIEKGDRQMDRSPFLKKSIVKKTLQKPIRSLYQQNRKTHQQDFHL